MRMFNDLRHGSNTRVRAFFLSLMVLVTANSAAAEMSRMTWTGVLSFNPNSPVPGGTAGSFWAEFYGPSAQSGQVPISGTLVFDTATPVSTQNRRFTASRGAVRVMEFQFGQVTVAADFQRIATQAHLSGVGAASLPNGAFCTMDTICDDFGLVAPGWGNHANIILESQHFSGDRDIGEQVPEFGSAFTALVGDTPQFGDFTPTMTTRSHGVVALNAAVFTIRSFPGQPHFRELRLPHLRTLIGAPPFEEVAVNFDIETQGVPGAVEYRGIITQMSIDP